MRRGRSPCRKCHRGSQRTCACHAACASSLVTDVVENSQRVPAREFAGRNWARQDANWALHGRSAPFLLARAAATTCLPGGPPTLPARTDVASTHDRFAGLTRADGTFAVRATDFGLLPFLPIAVHIGIAVLGRQREFRLVTRVVTHTPASVLVVIRTPTICPLCRHPGNRQC